MTKAALWTIHFQSCLSRNTRPILENSARVVGMVDNVLARGGSEGDHDATVLRMFDTARIKNIKFRKEIYN